MMGNLIGDYRRPICRATGKVIYTRTEAGALLNSLSKHRTSSHIGKGGNKPKRSYFCKVCGGYHVTHFNKTFKEKKPLKEIYR